MLTAWTFNQINVIVRFSQIIYVTWILYFTPKLDRSQEKIHHVCHDITYNNIEEYIDIKACHTGHEHITFKITLEN